MTIAMILAAGRGKRMQPLSNSCPKPLLEVAGKPLIVWQIEALARANFKKIIINHAWLGSQIETILGDGKRYGVEIIYSREGVAKETAGAIAYARHLLKDSKDSIFLATSADIYTHYDYSRLHQIILKMQYSSLYKMHLVLVPNPTYHQLGDFSLAHGKITWDTDKRLTFANIGIYHLSLFEKINAGETVAMNCIFRDCIQAGYAYGEYFDGLWCNIGSPEQLENINQHWQKPPQLAKKT